jgi:prepilin-type N-terminal cleavage/methylation domain-containing protein
MNKSPRRLFIRRQSGFSLVEMIGVLAIIAILAVVIVPKVFSTIASSRITNAVASITSMKTAVADFAGKFGTMPVSGTTTARLDDLLVTAGFLDSRFAVKIGTQPVNPPIVGGTWARNASGVWAATGGTTQASQSRLVSQTSTTTSPATAGGRNFQLDGANDLPAGSIVITAILTGLTANEAKELSSRIDGDVATETTTSTADARGKVVYAAGTGTKTVYVYLAHQ